MNHEVVLIAIAFTTILIGNILYFFAGILKKIGVTSLEEMNEGELVVTPKGILAENPPDEILNPEEASSINLFGRILFALTASVLWLYLGLTAGFSACLLKPSTLWKLIVYFLIYFIFLRIPFGITNKTIEKTYEIKVMPEKLLFAFAMIVGFIIGINYYYDIPNFLKWQFDYLTNK